MCVKPHRFNFVVIGCLAVFVFLYYVDVFCVIVPWLSYSVPGVTNLGILTLTTGASIYCYLFCVLLDPGRVPHGWQPDAELNAVQEVKKKGGAPRFCQKCQQYKPPRTHHCRKCERCVLRMDHHCPWTNNCIGHANYRAFFVFLIYVNAALIHTLGLLGAHTLHMLQTSHQQRVFRTGPQGKPVHMGESGIGSIWLWALLQTLAFFIALPLTLGLLMLLIWHVQMVASNKTTIEYREGVTATVAAAALGETYRHPYNLGMYANLDDIFGPHAACWLAPPCRPADGGTRYPTVYDDKALGLGL